MSYSYTYSSFGSLLSNSGMYAIKNFTNNSTYMTGINNVATDNTYTNTKKEFSSSIFTLGTQGDTGSYSGVYNTTAASLEKNFYSMIASYMGSASASSFSNSNSSSSLSSINSLFSSSTSSKSPNSSSSSASNQSGNNILAAASARTVSDLIASLPKYGNSANNLLSGNKASGGKMSSLFA